MHLSQHQTQQKASLSNSWARHHCLQIVGQLRQQEKQAPLHLLFQAATSS
jgi:hypothetical protein